MFMFAFLERWCVELLSSQRHLYYFLMGFITTRFISLLTFSITFANYAHLTLQKISFEEIVFKLEMAKLSLSRTYCSAATFYAVGQGLFKLH